MRYVYTIFYTFNEILPKIDENNILLIYYAICAF